MSMLFDSKANEITVQKSKSGDSDNIEEFRDMNDEQTNKDLFDTSNITNQIKENEMKDIRNM